MQLSLRSQMIAGTTAVLGATAIAMTPVAPAVQLPSLHVTKADVALAAVPLFNPISELLATAGLGVNYLLNGATVVGGTPADLWPGSGIGTYVNDNVLPGLGFEAVGVIPNILANPAPALTQLVNNWLQYTNIAVLAGGTVAGVAADLAWLPVNLTGTIITDILSGNIAGIPDDIALAINDIVTGVTTAVNAVIGGVTAIANGVALRGTAVFNALAGELPLITQVVQGQIAALVGASTNVFTNVTTAVSTLDLAGAWNAAVAGLLGPGSVEFGPSIPGTLVNLTLGAGVQLNPSDPSTYVPSVRGLVQGAGVAIADALATPLPAPLASTGTGRRAAAASSATVASSDSSAKKPAGHRSGARAGAAKAKAGR